jgi:hypothetical protein
LVLPNARPGQSQTCLELTFPVVRITLQQAADEIWFHIAANILIWKLNCW